MHRKLENIPARAAAAIAALVVALSTLGATLTTGAERTDAYLDRLKGKKVALYTNHTGRIGDRATVDVLLEAGIDVVTLFSPEHGIRGNADAGEHVASGTDPATGLPVVSLFGGKYRERMRRAVAAADVIVTDIQDVGLRYYTYYITMIELMEEAAATGKPFIVLDRPNPLGMTVDGPILDMRYRSGVGRLPIPTVHGLTLGELASMANGEGWLRDGLKADLEVVTCDGYTHQTRYRLPVAPSPNLPTMRAIYLYPSLCYFEATPVSLGRGTDMPFEVYGHPAMKGRTFSFVPSPRPGAKNPPQSWRRCMGVDLRDLDEETLIERGIDLSYLIDAYRDLAIGDSFFTPFFEKLMGRGDIRTMIEAGASPDEIKASWRDDTEAFKTLRAKYLLYPDSTITSNPEK